MVTEETSRNEEQAMNNKYEEVLTWELQFTEEIEEMRNNDQSKKMKQMTYKQKNEGARYIVVANHTKNKKFPWAIWDREEKKMYKTGFPTKRSAQNEIDSMGDEQ